MAVIQNEANWFPAALAIATLATAVAVIRRWPSARALCLYYGLVIAIMGSGHLLVVTIRAVEGTLSDGVRWFLYPLGLVLAVPGWLLVASSTVRSMTTWNALLIVVLAALGPSATLAVPAALNLIHLHTSRRWLRYAVVGVSAALYATLLCVALVLGSGR